MASNPPAAGCPLCGAECRCGLVGLARLATTLDAPSTLCNQCGNPSPSCTCRRPVAEIGLWLAALAATVTLAVGGTVLGQALAERTGLAALAALGPVVSVVWLAVLLRVDRRRAVPR